MRERRHTIRIGCGISVTIWENRGDQGTWYEATLSRIYRDENGKLQESTRFRKDELPFVAIATQKGFDFLLAMEEAISENANRK